MKPRALITGASRGIGAAIAEALARDGFPVILNYRSSHEAAQALKEKIEAAGGQAELLPFDVADAAEAGAAMEKLVAEDEQRPVGVVVNNAGITRDGSFPVMERPDWEAVTRCTLDGFYT
jgi:3-oxoacyl-[acyl-carrier protein] reductase